MRDTRERLDYLDMCKGFAIIAITLGHIYENNFIRIWLCSFHLPLFFIVSGILIKHTNTNERSIKDIVWSRFKRLIIPYFCFEMVAIIIWMISNNEFNLSTFRWNIIDTILLYQKAGATWFLPTAFIAEIVLVVLMKFIKKDKIIFLLSIIIYVIPFFVETENHYFVVILRIFTAIGFLAFGYFACDYIKKINVKSVYIAIITFICVIFAEINNTVDLYGLKYNNPLIYTMCSVMGAICLIFFFKNHEINKFKYFGKNSLIIMATQQIILGNFINPITGIYSYGYVNGLLILAIVMIIEVPIIYIVNNYLPWMLGQFKKN